ncbi:MAG: DUF4194 domain-containing protein [Candidatus Didemnitutus sp.]|nr:DUF4194 domain-containing protein [Candidatus Didemnitutus sp.]
MSIETPAFLQTPDWQVAAVNLLQGPVFEHEGERWRRVSHGKADLNGYFRQIGLRVIVDPVEGYAYLEQLPEDEMRDLPRIVRRRQLSLGATIYGFFLRQELDRAIKDDPNVTRVRRNLRQIRELVAEFFPATNNDSADRKVATGYLTDLAELGFVKRIAESGDGNESEYELTRLLRAKFNPIAAEQFLERIKSHLARRQTRSSHESA